MLSEPCFEVSGPLLPHQEAASAFLLDRSRAVLADDMGLGKSRAVAAAVLKGCLFPAVILCESGMREAWAAEVRSLDKGVPVSLPSSPADPLPARGFVVLSYSRVRQFFRALVALAPQCFVVDEAHLLRRAPRQSDSYLTALRHAPALDGRLDHQTLVFALGLACPRLFALTGTPVLASPADLFPLLRLIRHPLAVDYRAYALRYCAGTNTSRGLSANGASHIPELLSRLSGYFLRRRRSDVLPLPPKTRELVWLDLPPAALKDHERVWQEYVATVRARQVGRAAIRRATAAWRLTLPTLLDEIASTSKVPAMFARFALCGSPPTVMFTTRRRTLAAMVAQARDIGIPHVVYHGGLTEREKVAAVTRFQSGAAPLFLASFMSARQGITLTKAALAMFANCSWTPGDHEQAEDRLCRIGQLHPVHFVYFLARNTTDEGRLAVLRQKVRLTQDLLSGGWSSRLPDSADLLAATLSTPATLPMARRAWPP